MINLQNKIIIVTGGNGLLGKAIVSKLRSLGSFCINFDITHETNEDLSLVKCDITDTVSVDSCLTQIMNKYKKIDGLVNNAYPRTSDWGEKFENVKLDSWSNNVEYQLNSCFYITQQVSKIMVSQNEGSIINFASIYGQVGPDFTVYDGTDMTSPVAYSAIKGGVISLTKYLASYFGKNNIRVNCISPGGIFNHQNSIFVDNYNKKVPMRRMGKPEDISPLVAFLLSDGATYITGQNIAIDGGWTAI